MELVKTNIFFATISSGKTSKINARDIAEKYLLEYLDTCWNSGSTCLLFLGTFLACIMNIKGPRGAKFSLKGLWGMGILRMWNRVEARTVIMLSRKCNKQRTRLTCCLIFQVLIIITETSRRQAADEHPIYIHHHFSLISNQLSRFRMTPKGESYKITVARNAITDVCEPPASLYLAFIKCYTIMLSIKLMTYLLLQLNKEHL